MLSLHLAHRRAEADLRRFKAHVEFINPDVYENTNGRGSQRLRILAFLKSDPAGPPNAIPAPP